jgi:hypothetical protein
LTVDNKERLIAHLYSRPSVESETPYLRTFRNLIARTPPHTVFLRKLEYCEGVMFLTTNRVAQFDEAILSRIHLMLRYDDLNQAARTTIWGHFLDRVRTFKGPAEIKPEELSRLVTVKFNGRQISLPIVHLESP